MLIPSPVNSLRFFTSLEANDMAQKPRGRPKAFHDKTDQNTVQALDRGLDILTHVALNPGRTLSEIAEDTGEAIATVFRALVTLQGHGMVEAD